MYLSDLLNIIKWQAKIRMPNGDLYEKVYRRIKNKNRPFHDNIKYYFDGYDLYDFNLDLFIEGTENISKEKIDAFFGFLNNYFLSSDGSYYSFPINGKAVSISIPTEFQRSHYKKELFDLIVSYSITNDLSWQHIPFYQGPYEYIEKGKDEGVYLEEGDTVFDLGASYGMFSAYASSKGCDVYAFEPMPFMVRNHLSKTSEVNANIKVIPMASLDRIGTVDFSINYKRYDRSRITEIKKLERRDYKDVIKVLTTTLDYFVVQNKIKKVDFIKASIEGSELKMLKGARECLKEFAPKLALTCNHSLGELKRIRNLLKDVNQEYEVYDKWGKVYAYIPQNKK